jgi:hypothetical protein
MVGKSTRLSNYEPDTFHFIVLAFEIYGKTAGREQQAYLEQMSVWQCGRNWV